MAPIVLNFRGSFARPATARVAQPQRVLPRNEMMGQAVSSISTMFGGEFLLLLAGSRGMDGGQGSWRQASPQTSRMRLRCNESASQS